MIIKVFHLFFICLGLGVLPLGSRVVGHFTYSMCPGGGYYTIIHKYNQVFIFLV